LLEQLGPDQSPVGHQGTSGLEVVRFGVSTTTAFPASAIAEITAPTEQAAETGMRVNFMGLTGPSGVLPRCYTDLLVRRHIDFRGPERFVLRDWFDLFNHRLISLFHRAWRKYRFWLAFERGDHRRQVPDAFTMCLRSLIGLGTRNLRNRLHVSLPGPSKHEGREAARIQDLSLLRYAGLLGQRPRATANLESILTDYFGVPAQIEQFQGQWLHLEAHDQARLGSGEATAMLGTGAIVGPRVWDIQGKFRVRLGPLGYEQFRTFFPDLASTSESKAFFLLSQLVRLFVGPDFDFDVQLVLRGEDVPATYLAADEDVAPRLGWNTWLGKPVGDGDAEEAIIPSQELTRVPVTA